MRARERGRTARPHPEFVAVSATTHAHAAAGTTAAGGDRPAPDSEEQTRGPGATKVVNSGADAPAAQAAATAAAAASARSSKLWLNAVDGTVWASPPDPCREVRGGLLCDEPGLGKTITVLALLLRTRGLLPGERVKREAGARNGLGFSERQILFVWATCGMPLPSALGRLLAIAV